jgi:hypothetical protein
MRDGDSIILNLDDTDFNHISGGNANFAANGGQLIEFNAGNIIFTGYNNTTIIINATATVYVVGNIFNLKTILDHK